MDEQYEPEPWHSLLATLPFLFTISKISLSLVYLSFPHRFNRYIIVGIVGLLTFAAWETADEFIPDPYAVQIYLRTLLISYSHFAATCLEGKDVHAQFRKPPKSPWMRGYKLLYNARAVGLHSELPYLYRTPHTPPPQTDPPTTPSKPETNPTPSRSITTGLPTGIPHRLLSILLRYLLIRAYYSLFDLALHLPIRPSDTLPSKESLIRRALAPAFFAVSNDPVTPRDLVVRLWTILDSIIPDYLMLSLFHDITATLFISAGLDTNAEWPPLFGPVREAYNMRRYWSFFWHRLVYISFKAHVGKVLDVFGLRRRGLARRFLINMGVFVMSAVMHACVSWRLGNECAWNRHLWFYELQPVAFVLEGVVGWMWAGVKARVVRLERQPKVLGYLERGVGYVWVFVWMFWCVPKLRFPMLFCPFR